MTSKTVPVILKSLFRHSSAVGKKTQILELISKRTFSLSSSCSTNDGLSYIHNVGKQPLMNKTIGKCLEEAANKWPDRPWIVSCHEESTLTFGQVLEEADKLAAGLIECGFQKGDRLGIASPNYTKWVISAMAAARAGVILVAINPVYMENELEYSLKKVGAKGLIIPKQYRTYNYYNMMMNIAPELENCKPGNLKSAKLPDLKLIVLLDNEKLPGVFTYDDLKSMATPTAMQKVSELQNIIQADDGCNIQFTSGTTGKPKGAYLSHNNFVNNSYLIGKRNELSTRQHKICVQVPLFHAYGLVIVIMPSLQYGSTMVLPAPLYSPNESLKSIIKHKCTFITGTPTMYVDLISKTRESGAVLKSPEIATIGGALCSPKLFEQTKKSLNISKIKSLYGMTETSAVVFQSLQYESMQQVTETVGHIQEHTEAQVVDAEGKIVPFGTPGELWIRGYCNMLGYWEDPEKTSEMITPDKWLKTGDQFVLQKDGYGKIVGRLKDIIIRGGENVFPKEIENFLNEHPDVIESHVFGVKDERLGEEICVGIRSKEGSNFDHEKMKTYCQGKISNFKIPRYSMLLDSFPKTASGKVQKFKLREMFENEHM